MNTHTVTWQIQHLKRLIIETDQDLADFRQLYAKFKKRKWLKNTRLAAEIGQTLLKEKAQYERELKELILQ